MHHRRTRDTAPTGRILLWVVLSQDQWRSISAELFSYRHRRRSPHPSQRNGGCSIIIEESEVSRQHPSRTGSSRRRNGNRCSHNNLQQGLADRRMANPVDPVLGHHASKDRQPTAVQELLNDQVYQPSKQSHAEQTEIVAEEQAGVRVGRSTTEQIFNLRILCEKHLQHMQDLHHFFNNFTKASTGFGM